MIQALIIKKVLEVVFKKIETKHKLNKLKKYVEEDNELDLKVRELEKRLKAVEKVSHKPRNFVCLECGCKAKKLKTRRK